MGGLGRPDRPTVMDILAFLNTYFANNGSNSYVDPYRALVCENEMARIVNK